MTFFPILKHTKLVLFLDCCLWRLLVAEFSSKCSQALFHLFHKEVFSSNVISYQREYTIHYTPQSFSVPVTFWGVIIITILNNLFIFPVLICPHSRSKMKVPWQYKSWLSFIIIQLIEKCLSHHRYTIIKKKINLNIFCSSCVQGKLLKFRSE